MRAFLGASSFDPRRLARLMALAVVGVLLLVVVAPGCGRSSLEPESLGLGGGGVCSASTCPDGCCDSAGVCRTGSDLRACGSAGGGCSDCLANGFALCTSARVCGRDEPRCGASTCTGCCKVDEGTLRCLSGTAPTACGRTGAQCADCAEQGRSCDPTSRSCGVSRCDATNCDGCCVGDQCLAGTALSACGAKGAQCTTCARGQQCRTLGGGNGGQCEGVSDCGPHNCNGCCNAAGVCLSGFDSRACGSQGEKCDACGTSEICVGGSTTRSCQPVPSCGPGNCAGCCVGNQCVTATTPSACGANGQACKTCGATETCNAAGNCVPAGTCNPSNCAGCCIGDICAVGTQETACGTGGALCQNCANQNRVCQGGACQLPACGPATCPNGCCSGNTCVVGTQDNACGPTGGGACTNCAASNQICSGRKCIAKCGPGNCGGCCQPNNTCDALGISNSSCGEGGAACSNCTAMGSFCNGLVTPRQCNNQQTTCPAPYGQCPLGVTMPITTALQNLCSDAALDSLTAACAGGPDALACVAAFAALPVACRTCLAPFNRPFAERAGLFACVASSVGAPCRRAMGCAVDCADTSCEKCMSTSEDQCRTLVNSGFGQCGPFALAATCANPSLAGGLCSQFSYPNFGAWLRGVGDHFCGNGP